jgi:hypothetical protein
LLQAREYEVQGYRLVQPWVDTSAAAMTTETGKRLAVAAQNVRPDVWWAEFAARYNQPQSRSR